MSLLTFCQESQPVWALVGKILVVFKIVIPLLLIVFGMIDLGKAVISSDEKAITKATNTLIKRLIAAVVIFFIPYIVGAVFSLIDNFKDDANEAGYNVCRACVVKPYSSDCKDAGSKASSK